MKISFITALTLLLCMAGNLFAKQSQAVKPNPEVTYQTIEGWGSSLCWWAHMVGQWDDEAKIDEIVDLLTAPDQLNMNVFRYNIGGGDDPSHYSTPDTPGHMAKGKGVRAEMEGFKPTEDGPYNWAADAGQRKIMLKIKAKRPDAIFEAFSNSPPYWMTYSGCSAGNKSSAANNLKPEYYEAFCDYLIEVCQHYKTQYGIEFKTLEPFNEPQTHYWGALGGQEGCHFDIESQIKLIPILHQKLQDSGLNTVISASDETDISSFIKAMTAYNQAGNIMPKIGQINTHTYSGSDQERILAKNISARAGKTLWQSETGPMDVKGRGFKNNLGLAQKQFRDLKLMQPTVWCDWQMLEEYNDTWCVISSNFKNETYQTIKNFYVRMQVTQFIKPGYKVVEVNNTDALAAISADKKEAVLVIINNSGEDKKLRLDLSGFALTKAEAKAYRTSVTENCKPQAPIKIKGSMLKYKFPDKSISTFIIPL